MTYLGDGVCVERDGDDVILTTTDGVGVTNRIFLEKESLARFLEFVSEEHEDDEHPSLTDAERNPGINDDDCRDH